MRRIFHLCICILGASLLLTTCKKPTDEPSLKDVEFEVKQAVTLE